MYIRSRWFKIIRDIFQNLTRSLLVVFSVAIGIFSVGVVFHIQTVVLNEMESNYTNSNPASASVYAGGLDEKLVESIRNMSEVADAEGRSNMTLNVQADNGEWKPISITSVRDINDVRINKIILPAAEQESSATITGQESTVSEEITNLAKGDILFERSSLNASGLLPAELQVGDLLSVRMDSGKIRELRYVGTVYEPNTSLASMSGNSISYVSPETFKWLGGSSDFYDLVNIVVAESRLDKAHIVEVSKEVEKKIWKSERWVLFTFVPTPGELPLQTLFQSISLLLSILGISALILGTVLVNNIISALLAQQIRQIGAMKALGATQGQIAQMYVVYIVICSIMALMVAVPLRYYIANGLLGFVGSYLNLSISSTTFPTGILVAEIGIAIFVPTITALAPVMRGTRVTVREAISDYGMENENFGRSWIDRQLGKLRLFSQSILLSLRNTFRQRGRLNRTLLTLISGGIIFISIGSLGDSLNKTMDNALQYWQFDIQASLTRSYRTTQIEKSARAIQGVTDVETWGGGLARRVRPDDTESDMISLSAPPADSTMISPIIRAGRWLVPDDHNAIVLSQDIIQKEPDIQVGKEITLLLQGKRSQWVVVGIAQVIGQDDAAYVNYGYYSKVVGETGRANTLYLTINDQTPENTAEMAKLVEASLRQDGLQLDSTATLSDIRQQGESLFSVLIAILRSMAVLIAVIGGLGLMGTMSINVLERTREFGVMRSIGATEMHILRIVLIEGMMIGWMSWLASLIASVPLGRLVSNGIGFILFESPLIYTFAYAEPIYWFFIVTALAVISSAIPAWRASNITIREALSYE
ncbi:MAG: FtsX-like permease family protein [Chloroflexota bacterium]